MGSLTFNAATHEYRLDGVIVPGVTKILEPISRDDYVGVPRDVMERAALLGKAVHRMIELDLRDALDVEQLGDELSCYYTAWRNFLSLSGFIVTFNEARVHSTRYRFAGTLDLLGRLDGRMALIDVKRTALVPRTVGPQTAAYETAFRENHPEVGIDPIDRYALHLMRDGKWRLIPCRDKADLRVFLACLTITDWSATA